MLNNVDLGLTNKVAIVAAASKGLGKAVATTLAHEGCRIAICSRDSDAIQKAAESIGPDTFARAVDVTDEEQVKRFVEKVHEKFGRIDICVANAGGPPSKVFADTTTQDWETAIRTNLMSTLHFAHAVLPGMRARKWGRFITITSASVKQPMDGLILSNSIRSAVANLVKSLSNECGPDNVLVHNVCPGYTATDRFLNLTATLAQKEGTTPEAIAQRWTSQTALKRVGTPEEFANVVAFLASERASYLTGASIAIDGGLVKGIFS